MTVSRETLLAQCDALLQPANFKDYGPNGLQVEGKEEIRKIVSGVTASLALIAVSSLLLFFLNKSITNNTVIIINAPKTAYSKSPPPFYRS